MNARLRRIQPLVLAAVAVCVPAVLGLAWFGRPAGSDAIVWRNGPVPPPAATYAVRVAERSGALELTLERGPAGAPADLQRELHLIGESEFLGPAVVVYALEFEASSTPTLGASELPRDAVLLGPFDGDTRLEVHERFVGASTLLFYSLGWGELTGAAAWPAEGAD